jgi:hypothetical protein
MKLKLIQRFTRFKSEIKAVRTISLLISVPGNEYEEYGPRVLLYQKTVHMADGTFYQKSLLRDELASRIRLLAMAT